MNEHINNSIHLDAMLKANEMVDPVLAIKTYITHMSSHDDQLRQSLSNTSKSFELCWKYVQAKAKSHLNSKSGHVPPSIIYGWSIHYFVESDEFLNKEVDIQKQSISSASNTSNTNNLNRPTETPEQRMERIKKQLLGI